VAERVQDRHPRRDERRPRQDDQGPNVIGFGNDIPAFMLLPTRARRAGPSHVDAPLPEEADDLPVEE
jgi:hypothetical protein